MPITRIRSSWDAGSLVFSTDAGVEVARFAHATGALNISTLELNGVQVTATAAQLNSVSTQILVRNNAGALPAGSLVAVTGWDVGEALPEVTAAGGNLPATHVLVADSAGGDNVIADEEALVTGIDSDAIVAGSPVYLGAGGGVFGAAALTGADEVEQIVGVCVVQDAALGEVLFFPGYPRIMTTGTSSLQDDAVTNAKIVNNAVTNDKIANTTIAVAKLAEPPVIDEGIPSKGMFHLTGVTLNNEEINFGAGLPGGAVSFVLKHLTTDTTDDTSNDDFNNVTTPLTFAGYATRYPNSTTEIGDVILIAAEVLTILDYVAGTETVTFRRGVSGTTAAAHANGVNVLQSAAAAPAAADEVFVGVADNTAAAATDALGWDINNRAYAGAAVLAHDDATEELFLISAGSTGGAPVASNASLALNATAANIEVTNSTGRLAGRVRVSMQSYEVQADEATLGQVRLVFPFEPTAVQVTVFDATGLLKMDLTNLVTIAGYRVDIDDTGIVDLAATDVVNAIGWRVG